MSRIALLCATDRGIRVLDRVRALAPDAMLDVVTFREKSWEPPFLERVEAKARQVNASFEVCAHIEHAQIKTTWETSPPDVLLCVSWRYLVPASVYRMARRGAYVFHDSLLPRYRGFSPTVWAMINGETRTGATLFAMTDEMDAGDIVAQKSVRIGEHDRIGDVMEMVTCAYLDLLEDHFANLVSGAVSMEAQRHDEATYTCPLLPEDVRVDWSAPTQAIYNRIRAYTEPYPGAYTSLNRRKIHILDAKPVSDAPSYVGRVPGRVVEIEDNAVVVLTGDGVIRLKTLCFEDRVPLPAAEVIRSFGATLGT